MEIKDVLRRNEFTFKKKFGQNFLSDQNLLSVIAADAGVDEHTTVVEIGAGAGALTRALAKRAKRVVAFEIDNALAPVLEETLAEFDNVEVRFGDFMKANLPALEAELGDYVVAANLPYYVTTPVIMRFVEEAQHCKGFTVMVQEEVAVRFCAAAGSAEYGAVTAAIARKGRCAITRKVPREMFFPRPNVDSAVVHATFGEGGFAVSSARAYRDTVRCAFLNRRKTLVNNLMNTFRLERERAVSLVAEVGAEERARGETLTPQQLGALADALVRAGVLQ